MNDLKRDGPWYWALYLALQSQREIFFLQPIVDDLLLLWNGVPIINSTQKIVKAALLGVSSDMPALRKSRNT